MRTSHLSVLRPLAVVVLIAIAFCCAFGFLASFEPGFGGFPNVFHLLYGTIGSVALAGAAWLVLHGCMRRV